jgi:transposase-like protein
MMDINHSPDQADFNAQQLIRRTKQLTRRRFTHEKKVRILIEGIRREIPVTVLCRREGTCTNVYYKWLKDFMEGDKGRLKGDTLRKANRAEVETLSTGLRNTTASSREMARGYGFCPVPCPPRVPGSTP